MSSRATTIACPQTASEYSTGQFVVWVLTASLQVASKHFNHIRPKWRGCIDGCTGTILMLLQLHKSAIVSAARHAPALSRCQCYESCSDPPGTGPVWCCAISPSDCGSSYNAPVILLGSCSDCLRRPVCGKVTVFALTRRLIAAATACTGAFQMA